MAAVSDGGTSRAPWRKPGCGGDGGNYVEAGVAETGWVPVRDTTDRAGGTLSFPASARRSFAKGLKRR